MISFYYKQKREQFKTLYWEAFDFQKDEIAQMLIIIERDGVKTKNVI